MSTTIVETDVRVTAVHMEGLVRILSCVHIVELGIDHTTFTHSHSPTIKIPCIFELYRHC
jgi:hypothetical protein